MKKNKKYSWKELEKDCVFIVEQIQDRILVEIDSVYGIPRGGLIPATIMSHLLRVPLIIDKSKITPNTLIIDDISDSGHTLSKFVKEFNFKLFTATLLIQEKTKFVPNFWAKKIQEDKWIIYPWETDISTKESYAPHPML